MLNFPPITALLNRFTYLKSAKIPVPKSYRLPKSMNKLTLNEPVKRDISGPTVKTDFLQKFKKKRKEKDIDH